MPKITTAGVGLPWKLVLDKTAADSSYNTVLTPDPNSGLQDTRGGYPIRTDGMQYVAFRLFMYDTSAGGSCADRTATVDLWGWQPGNNRAILLSQIALTVGAANAKGAPPDLSSQTQSWYEADTGVYASGIFPVIPYSYPGGSWMGFVETAGCYMIQFRCSAINANSQIRVIAQPRQLVPVMLEIPFEGYKSASGATLTDAKVGLASDSGATELPAPGSGWQYVIQEIHTTGTWVQPLTIHTGAAGTGILFGPQTIPTSPGVAPRNLIGGLACGDNKQILLTTGGNITGQISVRGVKRPLT